MFEDKTGVIYTVVSSFLNFEENEKESERSWKKKSWRTEPERANRAMLLQSVGDVE